MAELTFTQGQWVRCTVGSTVQRVLSSGSLQEVSVALLPQMHAGGAVGVWYPAGKRFSGMAVPAPVATVWPVDPVDGMPIEDLGQRLCFAADSVGPLSDCVLADLPAARSRHMDPESVVKFVEVPRG